MDFSSYLEMQCRLVDEALDRYLPDEDTPPARLHEAMRYSVFAGGKRMRPVLVLAAAEACGEKPADAMPAACAVECIHTYSLIHDDLPCMDDDDLRRGRPTLHKVFGEALAVLAGDALQALAFEIVRAMRDTANFGVADYVRDLAAAAGSRHLIAGQVMDIEAEGRQITLDELRAIHEGKTAALLTCCVRLGAMSANCTADQLAAVTNYGRALGLTFQVTDDILDVTQTSEALGKTAGKDAAAKKATYPSIVGLEESQRIAASLTEEAHAALALLGSRGDRLRHIADHLLRRQN